MDNEQAFAIAVYPIVKSLAIGFSLDCHNVLEPADLTQVGMIAALKLYRRTGKEPVASLIRRAARMEMIDLLRSNTHRGKLQYGRLYDEDNNNEETLECTIAIIPSPEPAIVRAIDVWNAVDELPEPERQVARGLSEGKTLREIGEEMGLSETWVFFKKVRLRNHFRARRRRTPARTTPEVD